MVSNGRKVVAVLGPTSTGKSDLALYLASKLGGEVVNADSMQVYRHFDVGTAKPDKALQEAVPHHLIDVVEPSEEFNAALFRDMADLAIRQVWSRGRVPLIAGGTGLYLRALIYGLFKVPGDEPLRTALRHEYAENPLDLYGELERLDPEYAAKISWRDKIRVVRALEVFRLTGITMSRWEKEHGFKAQRYTALKIGLTGDRQDLYRRINDRVERMLQKGWIQEVRDILRMGYGENSRPFAGIGYREVLCHVKGSMDYKDMVRDIKTCTRHYAKRQITWFSKERGVEWYEWPRDREAIEERVSGFLS
jgi:tRNA dimethylallyltransferase